MKVSMSKSERGESETVFIRREAGRPRDIECVNIKLSDIRNLPEILILDNKRKIKLRFSEMAA